MKTTSTLLALALGAFVCTPVFAAEEHKHDHDKKIAGPNGGRVITAVEPHLEFLVLPDRKVKITALGEDNKPTKLGAQSVSITAGERSKPTKLSFAKDGESLVSDVALPAGDDYPLVAQIKTGADAKPVLEKFTLNLSDCPECDLKEYACICDHDHDHEKGDKKKGK